MKIPNKIEFMSNLAVLVLILSKIRNNFETIYAYILFLRWFFYI